ncbi:hypothetical protein HanRHA438_Chr15g0699551 [Helianthus annuus]|nr:hypothetical protein HanIR_Chr15g0746851 [Helianthus annuus]KAJ0844180.1 hypothetical protein HanRHA438_Chr15g0699551 [Helianthus annuus]
MSCATQTTRRRLALQTVCFLEDISLKKCLQTYARPLTKLGKLAEKVLAGQLTRFDPTQTHFD